MLRSSLVRVFFSSGFCASYVDGAPVAAAAAAMMHLVLGCTIIVIRKEVLSTGTGFGQSMCGCASKNLHTEFNVRCVCVCVIFVSFVNICTPLRAVYRIVTGKTVPFYFVASHNSSTE